MPPQRTVASPAGARGRPGSDRTRVLIDHVREQIVRGALRPGDRLPPERELALRLGLSRPTVRAGLKALSAMGVAQTRHGSGTYISSDPLLETEPLRFAAALHGFTREEMFEARRMLEVAAAGLAAERATPDHIAQIADEVTNLFAAIEDRIKFLVHDIRFHRAVAAASGNPIVASLVEMLSALYYEQRRETAARASGPNLHDAAEMHRRIYQAVRAGHADRARQAMDEHLLNSAAYQAAEETARSGEVAPPRAATAADVPPPRERATARVGPTAESAPTRPWRTPAPARRSPSSYRRGRS